MASITFALAGSACGAATEGRWQEHEPQPIEPESSAAESREESASPPGQSETVGSTSERANRGARGRRNSVTGAAAAANSAMPQVGNPTPTTQIPAEAPPTSSQSDTEASLADAPQVTCDSSPQLVIFDDAGLASAAPTPPSWLAVSSQSDRISWHHPASSLTLQLTAGQWEWFEAESTPATEAPPDGLIDPDVPWADLLASQATSTALTLERFSALYGDAPGAIAAESGGLSITPNGKFVLQSRCDEGEPSVRAWNTADGQPAMYVEPPAPCFTSVLALDDAVLLGSRNGIRSYLLPGGEPTFEVNTDGIVGRIDASADAQRLALALVRVDLIDLEPGMFEAVGQLTNNPQYATDTSPEEYPIGGALLPNADFSPGYVTVPHAVHPGGATTAYFTPDGRLILRSAGLETELLDEAPPTSIEDAPQAAALPTLLDFTPNGAWLLAVSGRWLNVFACR